MAFTVVSVFLLMLSVAWAMVFCRAKCSSACNCAKCYSSRSAVTRYIVQLLRSRAKTG